MEFFEFDGEKYKEASAHQQEWGEKLIAELDLRTYKYFTNNVLLSKVSLTYAVMRKLRGMICYV